MSEISPPTTRTPFTTNIVAVTVYPDQARVIRRGKLDVVPASYLLAASPLPMALQLDSIQIHSLGSAEVTLQRPVVEPIAVSDTAVSDTTDFVNEQSLHALEDEFRHAKDEISALALQKTFLESLVEQISPTFARGLADQGLPLEAVTDFLTFFQQTYQRVSRAIVVQERVKHRLDSKLQALRQELLGRSNKPTPHEYELLLPIQVHTPGTLELEIVYSVDQAQWQPMYEIRVGQNPALITLDCLAEIQQRTGEDWHEVAIAVSTAVPEKNPVIPTDLLWQTQSIASQEETASPSTQNRLRTRSNVLEDTYRMLGAVPGSEIPHPKSADDPPPLSLMKLVGTTLHLTATEAASVPTDGNPRCVSVGRLDFAGHLTYVAISQRYSAPYLVARLCNPPDSLPLLPGKAYLFRGGGYLGEEELEYVPPGSSFEVSLGLDDRVLVQRQLVHKEAIVADPCKNLRALRLMVHNPFDYPVVVNVVEQIPTSRAENVRISLTNANPEPVVNPSGICQWSLKLAPQASQEIYYECLVEHPCDVPIWGMDG